MQNKKQKSEEAKRLPKPYEKPVILYEGQITTRAGSPTLPDGLNATDAVDPADLFGGDEP